MWQAYYRDVRKRGQAGRRQRIAPSIELCTVRSELITIPERKCVTEVVIVGDILVVLFDDGLASVYDRLNSKFLCHLLDPKTKVVRTACYNKWNHSVFIVWHCRVADPALRIQILSATCLSQGVHRAHKDVPLTELIVPFPGFVEFEEQNARIVTSTSIDGCFKFWDMKTYDLAFTVGNEKYKEMRISNGTVAFFEAPTENRLLVKLCDVETGDSISDAEITLLPRRSLRFLELCGSYLLYRQDGACLRVHDLKHGGCQKVPHTRNFQPQAVTFFPALTPSSGCPSTVFVTVNTASIDFFKCDNGKLVHQANLPTPPLRGAEGIQLIQCRNVALLFLNHLELGGFKQASDMQIFDQKSFGAEQTDDGHSVPTKCTVTSRSEGCTAPLRKGIALLNLVEGNLAGEITLSVDEVISTIAYDAIRHEILVACESKIYSLAPGLRYEKEQEEYIKVSASKKRKI